MGERGSQNKKVKFQKLFRDKDVLCFSLIEVFCKLNVVKFKFFQKDTKIWSCLPLSFDITQTSDTKSK